MNTFFKKCKENIYLKGYILLSISDFIALQLNPTWWQWHITVPSNIIYLSKTKSVINLCSVLLQVLTVLSALCPPMAAVCLSVSSPRTVSGNVRSPWPSPTSSSSYSRASPCPWQPSWPASSWLPPCTASSAGAKVPKAKMRRAKNEQDEWGRMSVNNQTPAT